MEDWRPESDDGLASSELLYVDRERGTLKPEAGGGKQVPHIAFAAF